MKLTIPRNIWMRGRGEGEGLLLEFDEEKGRQQCCVGIYLSALGVPDEELEGRHIPDREAGKDEIPGTPYWLLSRTREDAVETARLYASNDDDMLAEEERERIVTEKFARHGVEVEFADSLPPECSICRRRHGSEYQHECE